MKIIIDLAEDAYNVINSDAYYTFPSEMKEWGIEAIRNGTPLNIRHGKIINVNDLLEYIGLDDNDYNRDKNVGKK